MIHRSGWFGRRICLRRLGWVEHGGPLNRNGLSNLLQFRYSPQHAGKSIPARLTLAGNRNERAFLFGGGINRLAQCWYTRRVRECDRREYCRHPATRPRRDRESKSLEARRLCAAETVIERLASVGECSTGTSGNCRAIAFEWIWPALSGHSPC